MKKNTTHPFLIDGTERTNIIIFKMQDKLVDRLSKSLETHPFLDAPLEALAKKVKVHKVYLASGILIVSIFLAAAFGSGELLL